MTNLLANRPRNFAVRHCCGELRSTSLKASIVRAFQLDGGGAVAMVMAVTVENSVLYSLINEACVFTCTCTDK